MPDVPILEPKGRKPNERQRLDLLRGLAREHGVQQPEKDGLVVASPQDVPRARKRRRRK